MQLRALNSQNDVIEAIYAERKKDYTCPECKGALRLREGLFKQPHFYHFKEDSHCRQKGKSETHFQAQLSLLRLLPESELEVSFPEIQRVADVAWPAHHLIFEVQCSPITREEVEARTLDYQKVGYQVIWILHDKRFNQWRLTAAERYLLDRPHYFTNCDHEGNGIFYDQWQYIEKGIRKHKLPPLYVDFSKPSYEGSSLRFEGEFCTLKDFLNDLKAVTYLKKAQELAPKDIGQQKRCLNFKELQTACKESIEQLFMQIIKKHCH